MKRFRTSFDVNKGIVGDSIEVMLEKLRNGDGIDSIADRDLVYNDNETETVNPVTNIRTDRFDAMLDEKVNEYEHKHRRINVDAKKDEIPDVDTEDVD